MNFVRRLMFFFAATALFAGACGPAEASAPSPKTVKIAAGATVAVNRFLSVTVVQIEDSRCPKGVACVWAGEARVKLRIQPKGDKAVAAELVLGSPPKPARARTFAGGYRVELSDVIPYPIAPPNKDKSARRAVLTVTELTR